MTGGKTIVVFDELPSDLRDFIVGVNMRANTTVFPSGPPDSLRMPIALRRDLSGRTMPQVSGVARFTLAGIAGKLGRYVFDRLEMPEVFRASHLDTLPTARIISLEEAKTTKGSVYFTKEGPIVWE